MRWPGIALVAAALAALLIVLAVDTPGGESVVPLAVTPTPAPPPDSAVVATPEPDDAPPSETMVEMGRRMYALHCAVCHGDDLARRHQPRRLPDPSCPIAMPRRSTSTTTSATACRPEALAPGASSIPSISRSPPSCLTSAAWWTSDVELTIDLADDDPAGARRTHPPSTARRIAGATAAKRVSPILTPAASGNTPPQAACLG